MPPSPDNALISVVLVEDDVHFQNALMVAIAGAPDMRLLALAGSRAQGLQALQNPPADVLLVDLGPPDGSGIDVIRGAHSQRPDCAVMASNAFGDEAHVLQSIEASGCSYLLKDSTPEDMLGEIRILHRGGSPISPLIARQILTRFRGGPAIQAPGAAGALALPQPQLPAPVMLPGRGAAEQAMLLSHEMKVLKLITRSFTADEIARLMQVSSHTVRTYVRRIHSKLKVRSRAEAIYEARQQGILSP